MQCPLDSTALVMTERQGVEIDYCPTCRGVWLDRGELDKILDRSVQVGAAAAPVAPPAQQVSPGPGTYDDDRYPGVARDPYGSSSREGYRGPEREGHRDPYRDGHRDARPPYRKKKESWLGEIFDF